MRFGAVWLLCVAACGASSGGPAIPPEVFLEFAPTGGGWATRPVDEQLDLVSNNGAGYTGEIDRYEIVTPAAGRLQVALTWDHESDFDLILANDPEGRQRFAEGVSNDFDPEYVGMPVASGQRVWILVAGWEGAPGDYRLETALLPPEAPLFALDQAPDLDRPVPRNRALRFRFSVELDPEQDVAARVFLGGAGTTDVGAWCIEGRDLVFLPHLPVTPDDDRGFGEGRNYIVQFPIAGRGLRAVTGEYLTDVETFSFTAGGHEAPAEPPRVVALSHATNVPWDGEMIRLTISGEVDPGTLTVRFAAVAPDGAETALPAWFTLEQSLRCDGAPATAVSVAPLNPLPPGTALRLVLPGTVLGLGGDDSGLHGITGPAPAPAGAGVRVDFGSS